MAIHVTGKQSREPRASTSGAANSCNGLSGDVLEIPRVPVDPFPSGQGVEHPIREINTVVSVATITLSLPLAIRKTLLEQGMDTTCVRVRDTLKTHQCRAINRRRLGATCRQGASTRGGW
jgi:hypothetical protein